MAFLYADSFDHYVTSEILRKYTTITTGRNDQTVTMLPTGGRRGGGCLRITKTENDFSCAVIKNLPASGNTIIAGFAVNVTVPPPTGYQFYPIFQVLNGGVPIFSVRVNNVMQLVALRDGMNSTILGTSTGSFSSGFFYFIEIKVVLSNSVGTVDIRINGVSVLSLTGINTSSSAVWTGIAIAHIDAVVYTGGFLNTVDYDDLYVLDGSGAAPWNNFLGDCKVEPRVATAPGATTGWTPSTGANWQNVDDAQSNDDTDYNQVAVVATDTFVTQDAPVGATIFGVQHCINVRKTDAGPCSVAPVVRHSGADNVGSNFNPGLTYAYGIQMQQVNPGTAAQWTEAGFNAAEFGYKRTI